MSNLWTSLGALTLLALAVFAVALSAFLLALGSGAL